MTGDARISRRRHGCIAAIFQPNSNGRGRKKRVKRHNQYSDPSKIGSDDGTAKSASIIPVLITRTDQPSLTKKRDWQEETTDDSHPTKKRGRPRKEVLRPPLSPIKARSPNIHRTATEHAIIPTNTAANCGILHWPKGVPFATPRCIGMVSGSYGAVLSYTVAAMRASSSKLESVVSSGSEKMLTAFSESEFSGSLDTLAAHGGMVARKLPDGSGYAVYSVQCSGIAEIVNQGKVPRCLYCRKQQKKKFPQSC